MHALVMAVALLALGGTAERAPSADEQRLFDEGTRDLAAGDARGAEKAWRAGYELGHDPAFLVHIGEAEEKAGAPAEATESYRRYLREAPAAADRADIEQRVARLSPAAPVAPAPAVETPGEFGGTPPPAPASAPASAPAPAPTAPVAAPARPVKGDEEDSGWNRSNATAMIAAGVTVALLATGAFYAASAASHESDVNRLITFRSPPTQYSAVASAYTSGLADGRHDAHVADVLLLTAAGTGAVSIAFFILDALHAPPPAAVRTVSLAPPANGVGAVGGWSCRF
ncbi:MAG TPA: hypothetical protein VHG72_08820 [Polyangia bacterium]|nr:hypothetical protein [Polyangia bacterium]